MIKRFLVSAKARVAILSVVMFASSGTFVFADALSTSVVDSMKTAFSSLQATALTALGSIAVIAITLFSAIYAWRYGKQVFKIISK
jgi:hypothetical protein